MSIDSKKIDIDIKWIDLILVTIILTIIRVMINLFIDIVLNKQILLVNFLHLKFLMILLRDY